MNSVISIDRAANNSVLPAPPIALFDEAHGQANWHQTGFSARSRTASFRGLAATLTSMGLLCRSALASPLSPRYPETRLLVLPPATGQFDAPAEQWTPQPMTRYSTDEIDSVVRFVNAGGSLLAFGYRFGDSFTRSNLSQLTTALGCPLNEDAIVDLGELRSPYPLEGRLEAGRDAVLLPWASANVDSLAFRCQATFTILPGASVWPLVISPGGRCMTYHRLNREVCFQSTPIAVAGRLGRGRFVLLGGPHAFEDGELGLLRHADNEAFLRNVLDWLLTTPLAEPHGEIEPDPRALSHWAKAQQMWRGYGRRSYPEDRHGVEAVERVLSQCRTFQALSRE